MRAVLCTDWGSADLLKVDEVPAPRAGAGELIVAVHTCGVQFVDNRIVAGQSLLNTSKLDAHFGRSVQATLPLIPGTEAAGVVEEVGEGVSSVKVGDRVLGTCLMGAFAEKVRFRELEVCRIPDEMDMHAAAGFYSAYFTAYYALVRRAGLADRECLLVLGAGSGVGLAAVEIGKALGARVLAAASSGEKLTLARTRGADTAICYGTGPLSPAEQKELAGRLKTAAGPGSIHVVADLVGGTYAEPAMRCLAFKGRYLSIGFAAGVPLIPMHVIFNKNGALLGIEPVADHRLPGENPELMQALFRWYREGRLRPQVTEVYPLEKAGTALRRLADRNSAGRVVLAV